LIPSWGDFTRSEYNHCGYDIFIILVLNVILVKNTIMYEINRLAQLVMMFDMKDLGVTKQILGMEIHIDMKDGKLGYHNRSMW
jgi:hypothetical protein